MDEIGLLIALGVIVGANNLAVALALGALGQSAYILRVVLIFGVFEFIVPLIGILLGRSVSEWIEQQAAWFSIILLIGVGVWMIWSGVTRRSVDEALMNRVTTWGGLVTLATFLSLDNLVIGFSLGLMRVEPLIFAAVISGFSMIFAWLGMRMGHISRRHWEYGAEIIAGTLLVIVAMLALLGIL